MAADSTGTTGETPGPSTSMENIPPTYDEVFPALPESFPISSSDKVEMNGGSTALVNSFKPKPTSNTITKLKLSSVSQVYVVSPEERRFKDNNVFRERDQIKVCTEIMYETNTRIEMSNSKDGKLTFLISGKEEAVTLAKKKIAEAVQTKGEKFVSIPKEHHKFILGKNGLKLKDLEERTGTKITVPRQDDTSEAVKIVGTKDGIERAMHEILSVSHEANSKAVEKIKIPRYLHPFIRGPFDETINQIIAETGARIAIPPQEVNDETINIMGDPNSIAAAKARIMEVYEEKKVKCTSVPMQVKKAQHKYIIGRGGQTQKEIFKETGVYVDIPRQDDETDTVTLWGEPDKIGPALSVLWEKAHSEVEDIIQTEPWVHRHILGAKGSNFQELSQNFPQNIRVNFENDGIVRIRGPRNDLPNVRKVLEDAIAEIQSRISVIKLKIDPKYHRFIIGQKGKQISQIREESKAQVHIPDESDNSASSDTIRIEGSAEAVKKAHEMLTAIIDKQKERENEVTKELICEQRFHRNFIGTKGEEIRKIRDMFNQVAINFPDPSSKSDKVTIRGAKNDVEKCYKFLAQETQNLLANNYRLEVPISNQFFKLFTTKERVKIQQMSKETNTRIDLPSNQSNQPEAKPTSLFNIIISGKKDDAEKAKEMILNLQKELGNHVQIDIFIPAKFHNSLIGKKGSLIRSISEECGGVTINFPPENSGSDKVSIIGPKDMVTKAKQQLLELKNEKVENSFEVEITAKPELHRFLIGKKGTNINKLRTKTGVRIMFPADGEDISDGLITIVGKKDGVLKAKAELEEMIHDLEKIVEDTVKIPTQYHAHFKRISAQRQIKESLGDLQITFKGNNNDTVSIRGSKDCVEMAKARITEMVGDLEAQVTMEVVIPQVYHRIIMGKAGRNVQSIQSEHKVEIQFPKRDTGESKDGLVNGNSAEPIQEETPETQSNDKPKESNIIVLKGRKENCELAKAALLESIPVTKEVEVPFSFHRFIIGQKGANIREMKEKFDVDISVPPSDKQEDSIKVKGTKAKVEMAIEAINEKVQMLKDEQLERDAKNFKLEIQVDPAHHPKIIGREGKIISKIRKQFEVQIQFPKIQKNDDTSGIITIIGYEKNAEAAKAAILDIVRKLENTVSEEVEIDAKVHRRLIGARGRNINMIMSQFKVEVKFPKENSSNPNLVTISGEPENIERAREHLLSLQEDYLDDVEEQYRPPRQAKDTEESYHKPSSKTDPGRGFYVKGAPWDQSQSMPDTSNSEEFPSMLGDGGSETSESPKSRGWGLSSKQVASSLLQQ